MAELSYEHQLENEVARQRDAADKAAALIGTLSERVRFLEGAVQDELRRHMDTTQRFLTQAATIEEFGGRLNRIAERHTLAYEYLSDQEHQVNGICDRCRTPYPCEDRKDAEWNSKTT